jgi:hypothetical protein
LYRVKADQRTMDGPSLSVDDSRLLKTRQPQETSLHNFSRKIFTTTYLHTAIGVHEVIDIAAGKFGPSLLAIFILFATAQIMLHYPVNRLHSIELQADAIAAFYLTLPIEGVETYSFFDSF